MELRTFKTSKLNLFPSLIIWGIFYGILLALGSKVGVLGVLIVLGTVATWLPYIVSGWLLKSLKKMEIKEVDTGLEISHDNSIVKINWDQIKLIKFFSVGKTLTVVAGPWGKYLGFFRLETDNKKIDLPPSIGHLNDLLKLIIQKARLKKYSPTFEGSLLGGLFHFQRDVGNYPGWVKEEGYTPTQVDLNVNIGGLSKSAIQLFFVLLLGFIFVFFFLKIYIDNNPAY